MSRLISAARCAVGRKRVLPEAVARGAGRVGRVIQPRGRAPAALRLGRRLVVGGVAVRHRRRGLQLVEQVAAEGRPPDEPLDPVKRAEHIVRAEPYPTQNTSETHDECNERHAAVVDGHRERLDVVLEEDPREGRRSVGAALVVRDTVLVRAHFPAGLVVVGGDYGEEVLVHRGGCVSQRTYRRQ